MKTGIFVQSPPMSRHVLVGVGVQLFLGLFEDIFGMICYYSESAKLAKLYTVVWYCMVELLEDVISQAVEECEAVICLKLFLFV